MDENEIKNKRKKLRSFAVPHHEGYIGGGAFLALGLAGAVAGIFEHDVKIILGGVAFGVLLGGWILSDAIKTSKNFDARLGRIEQGGAMGTLINDFENGSKAFNDQLIVGKTFLIGRRTGAVLSYGEIQRMYQYIEKTNGIEDKRFVRVVTANDGVLDLCRLKLRGKSNDEFEQFAEYLSRVNPNIAFGYNG